MDGDGPTSQEGSPVDSSPTPRDLRSVAASRERLREDAPVLTTVGVSLLVLAGALALPPDGRAAKTACAGAVYEVLGEALLDRRSGGDAIRLGAGTVAVRSGCEDAPIRLDETRTGEQVFRAVFTHCAVDGASVSLWMKVRADCSKAVGRVAVLPERRLRLFEAVRAPDDFGSTWPHPCACEVTHSEPACERSPFGDC